MSAAPAPDFVTSFEDGQPQPEVSTVEVGPDGPRQRNVTGTFNVGGSLLGSVTGVTASAQNAPGEVAANLADANPDTKWLAFASTGWVRYQLASPAKAVRYSLTSANDAPERDPKDFRLEGSNDGTTWTTLDTRTNIDFPGRFATLTFDVTSPAAYGYYRLNVTAVHSGGIIQLADWDLNDGSTGNGDPTPMVTSVGAGPISGFNIKPLVGLDRRQGAAVLRRPHRRRARVRLEPALRRRRPGDGDDPARVQDLPRHGLRRPDLPLDLQRDRPALHRRHLPVRPRRP